MDLWGSVSDPGYDGDSLQTIWSSTKNLSALGVAMLVDRGTISYGDKITKHWPEFDRGQTGKGEVWTFKGHPMFYVDFILNFPDDDC